MLTENHNPMKNIALLTLILLSATVATAQASSTGLILNDDSVLVHHIGNPATLRKVDIQPSYNFMYSQEPDPRNFLLSAELELTQKRWRFRDSHTLTPRIDLIGADFMDYFLSAVAGGGIYRLEATESRRFDVLAEATLAPQLTTFGRGKFLWSFKTQLNYPVTDDISLNLGYRSITMKLLNNYEDGFERGLYFGITTKFK